MARRELARECELRPEDLVEVDLAGITEKAPGSPAVN
jgi:hypothetical protein